MVVDDGRVVGTWSVEDDRLTVAAFTGTLPPAALDGERARWSRILGRSLTLAG